MNDLSVCREAKYKKIFDLEALEMEYHDKVKGITTKYDPQITNLESKLEVSGSNNDIFCKYREDNHGVCVCLCR